MRPVNWLHRIIAFVLLAFWLPATSHCAIETVLGSINDHCLSACAHEHADGTTHTHLAADSCELVESGAFKNAVGSLVASAPILSVLACLSCVHAAVLAEARTLAPPA